MKRLFRGLSSLFSLAVVTAAQDPAADCAVALLRKDHAAAAHAAAAATAPASRARLQAAMLKLEDRPAAMLAVAQAFPADGEADHALLAGAAAIVQILQRTEAVRGLDAWTDLAGEGSEYAFDTAVLAPMVLAMRSVLSARKQAGDAALLREAERLLELATVSRFGLWPAQVARDAAWERPQGLAEDLHLRLLPCAPGEVTWDRIEALAAPAWQGMWSNTGEVKLPPMPPGNWLLEARSAARPWRGVRVVEVSDVDTVALAAGGVMVLAAFDRSGPIAAEWQLRAGSAERARGTIGKAPQLLAWPPVQEHEPRNRELLLQTDAGSAWLEMNGSSDDDKVRASWVAHGMVDRPLYRPGDRVQGRVLLRSCSWQGQGLAAVPSTRVAADQPLRVVVDLGSVGQLDLSGRTDTNGLFPFSFVVPAELPPGSWLPFTVALPGVDADGKPLRVHLGQLGGTAFFRRPSVSLRVDGPEEVKADVEFVEVAATVEWASGGPAADLDVRVEITARRHHWRQEAQLLRTGDDGRAVVRVPIAALGAEMIWIEFHVTGPDGRLTHHQHLVKVIAPGAKEEAAGPKERRWWEPTITLELGPAVVGSNCRVSLRAEPRQQAVLVAGRGSNARAQAVRLDDAGAAQVDVPVLRVDWPRLDVTVATRSSTDEAQAPVALRTTRAPAIDLPAHAEPGADVSIRIGTDAPGTVVTVAVVDERIYELQADRTPEPNGALAPTMPWWDWSHGWAPARLTPGALVGSLLHQGRIPPLDNYMRNLSRTGTGAGGRAASDSHPGGLRSDFRATAAFLTVIAGGDGAASVRFTLPSDLTSWRVTAVGIDPEGTGFVATRTLASRQPLGAEPLLPRGVRAGDTFTLPISIDRSSNASAPADTVKITAAIDGDALQVTAMPDDLALAAGRVARTSTGLRAVKPGTAKLSLAAELGSHSDRSQRDVTVGRDAVARPLQAGAMGTGEVAVPMPEGTSPDAGLTVDVLLGGSSAWRQLEQGLAAYPHGCVEQTLSRLVPHFAMARVAKQAGKPMPAMDAAFRQRLHGGLARLRSLLDRRNGFAFWPGGEADPGMTALALHGLTMLREGGYDPAQADLHVDADQGAFDKAVDRLREREPVVDAGFVMAAEVTVAVARFAPDARNARAAAAGLLAILPQLPAGLCARLGLLRHAVRDSEGARRCLDRLAAAATPVLGPDGFPGEDPLAVQALHLELATALRADPARAEGRAADLLLACLNGHGSTYAHACALAALAQALPPTPDVTATIEVRAGASSRTFTLGGEAGGAVHWRLPRAEAVTVRGPQRVTLLVRVATERSERASDHASWQTPVQVERELCESRADARWDERRDGNDLVPLQGPPLAGRTIALRVRVQSPVPMRFVVVECPLPAGFELGGESAGIDRYDDRIVFACDLSAGKPYVRSFRVVPTVAGRLLWPPTVAAPMYVSGLEGGTAGSFIDVVAATPGAVPAVVTCLTTPWPEPPPKEARPFDPFLDALYSAWSREPADEVASRREIGALLMKPPPVDETEQWRWLQDLTRLLDRLDRPSAAPEWPETHWRIAALDRMRALLRDATFAVLALPPATDQQKKVDGCWALVLAIDALPDDAGRQAMLAQLFARAPTAKCTGWLLGRVPGPITDAGLRAAVRDCLGSPDANVRQKAFAALPAAERAQLPPVLVLRAQPAQYETGVIQLLVGTEAGRSELRLRLCDSAFVLPQRHRLADELPAELWREVPLPVFRSLAASTTADEGASGTEAIATRVAVGPYAAKDLQRAMAAAIEPAWRAVLAQALRQRGVTAAVPAVRADDALWSLWNKALALEPHDAAGAQKVLDEVSALDTAGRLDREADLLRSFAVPAIAVAGTPEQLYAARSSMTETLWRAAWTRLDGPARVALIDHFQQRIGTTFVPATAAEAEAIWRFLQRSRDITSAVRTLAMSPPGVACIRQHLAAGDEVSSLVRKTFAEELGLDPETLQPGPGGEWRALARRIQQSGFLGEWTADELTRLATMRALRGVAPVVADRR